MWSRINYSRSLVGSLIIFVAIVFSLNSQFSWLVAIGGFLFFEHYLIWDRWDFYDYIIGHEWWGLYLMGLGFVINGSYLSLIVVVVGFLIGATYNYSNPIKEFMPTIKELFK